MNDNKVNILNLPIYVCEMQDNNINISSYKVLLREAEKKDMLRFLVILKKSNISKNIIVLFVLIIVIVAVFSSIAYYGYYKSYMQNELNNSYIETLNQTRQIIDIILIDIQKNAFILASNKNVSAYFEGMNMSQDMNVYYDIKINLLNSLKSLITVSSYIESVYLYSEINETVFTSDGIFDLEYFYDKQYIKETASKKYSLQWLETREIINDGFTVDCFTFVLGYPLNSSLKYGYILFNIKKSLLYDALSNIDKRKYGEILIYSEKNNIICNNNIINKVNELPVILSDIFSSVDGDDKDVLNLTKHKIIVYYNISEVNQWQYILIKPYDDLLTKYVTLRNVSLLIAFISFIIGLIYSLFASKMISKPIQRLAEGFNNGKRLKENELVFIQNQIENIIRQNETFRNIIQKNKLSSVNKLFFDVLSGRITKSADIINDFKNVGVNISDCDKFICLLRFNQTDLNNEKIYELIYNSIKKLFKHEYLMFLLENQIICLLVNTNERYNAYEFVEILDELNKYMNENFGMDFSAGIGQPYPIGNIFKSRQEAFKALEYVVFAKNMIVHITNVTTGNQNTDNNFETMNIMYNKIINLGKKAETDNAFNCYKSFMNEIIESKVSYEVKRVYVDQLILKLQMYAPKSNEVYNLSCIDFNSIDNLNRWIYQIILSLGNYDQNSNNELINKIIQYMEDNFSNSELTLQFMAEQFNINYFYLSKTFKQCTGENFLDRLNKIRIEKAAQLLISTDYSVSEICKKVGYNNIQSFSRFFKRYMYHNCTNFRKNKTTNKYITYKKGIST